MTQIHCCWLWSSVLSGHLSPFFSCECRRRRFTLRSLFASLQHSRADQ
jgi:hypothetical protein